MKGLLINEAMDLSIDVYTTLRWRRRRICAEWMDGRKNVTVIVEIGGLVYILSAAAYRAVVRTPLFQAYDPLKKERDSLPDPPFFGSSFHDDYSQEFVSFVIGARLYVSSRVFMTLNSRDGRLVIYFLICRVAPGSFPAVVLHFLFVTILKYTKRNS